MNCPACGGTIGADCFNPQECMEITRAQAAAHRGQYEQQQPERPQWRDKPGSKGLWLARTTRQLYWLDKYTIETCALISDLWYGPIPVPPNEHATTGSVGLNTGSCPAGRE